MFCKFGGSKLYHLDHGAVLVMIVVVKFWIVGYMIGTKKNLHAVFKIRIQKGSVNLPALS